METQRDRKNRLSRERRAIDAIAIRIVRYNLTEEHLEKALLKAMQRKLGVK